MLQGASFHFELPDFGKIKNNSHEVVICSFHQALGPIPFRAVTVGFLDGNYSSGQVTMEFPAQSMQLKGRGWPGFRFTRKWKPTGIKKLHHFRSGKLIKKKKKILPHLYQVCGDVVSSEESSRRYHQPRGSVRLQLVMNLMASVLEMSGAIWGVWQEVTFPPGKGTTLIPSHFPLLILHICLFTSPFSMLKNSNNKPLKKSKWHGF